ncbi:MAG: 1,4-dihydroxy-2-naphthoate polyprenyltransferase [Bdellovibrio sp.]
MLRVWFWAIRPKTLTASVAPVLVASGWALAQHSFQFWISLLALLSSIFIQIGTNLVNDAQDFKKGADRQDRLGPVRVSAAGLAPSSWVMRGAFICFFLSVLMGLPLVWVGGWPIVVVGLFSLLFGYLYTGGPYPLAYWGLGDLFVFLFFGWVAVGGVVYLQTGQVDFPAIILGSQVGLLGCVLISINNLRDELQDRLAQKRTLVVLLGRRWNLALLWVYLVGPFLLQVFWKDLGYFWLPLLLFPLAVWVGWKVRSQSPSSVYNSYLARGALLQLCFSLLLSFFLWTTA